MGLMEERLERKIDSKIDSLAKEMKQLLAEHLQSETSFHTPYPNRNRVFPRGRDGGRGSQWGYNGGRGSHLGFQGGRASHSGFVEDGRPPSPHSPLIPPPFDDEDEGTPWFITPQDPNSTLQRNRGNSVKNKLDLVPFDGYMHIEDFLDWLDGGRRLL